MPIRFTALCLTTFLLLTACSRPKPIVVGSKDSVEQQLLAEIVAQHLEHRLGVPVQRRFGMGDTRIVHQAMLNGDVSLYPEYSGLIVSELLRETPGTEASIVFERARSEMKRVELLEYVAPLGFDAPTALVVRAAGNEAISTPLARLAGRSGFPTNSRLVLRGYLHSTPIAWRWALPCAA